MSSGLFVYLLTPQGRVTCERRSADYQHKRIEGSGDRILATHALEERHMTMSLQLLEEIFPPPVRIEGHTFT